MTNLISSPTPAATSPAAAEPVLLRRDEGGVATLTLNRPAQFNALCDQLLAALMFAALAVRARARDPWLSALPAFGLMCLNLWILADALGRFD